jgi:hypothetical protein
VPSSTSKDILSTAVMPLNLLVRFSTLIITQSV